jgi:hypothetical protein
MLHKMKYISYFHSWILMLLFIHIFWDINISLAAPLVHIYYKNVFLFKHLKVRKNYRNISIWDDLRFFILNVYLNIWNLKHHYLKPVFQSQNNHLEYPTHAHKFNVLFCTVILVSNIIICDIQIQFNVSFDRFYIWSLLWKKSHLINFENNWIF